MMTIPEFLSHTEALDAKYKEEATAYFCEQRALVSKQIKYTKWTIVCSIAIAVATVVYAVFSVLAYYR